MQALKFRAFFPLEGVGELSIKIRAKRTKRFLLIMPDQKVIN